MDPITETGGVAADWVLVGITTILGTILVWLVSLIKRYIESSFADLRDITRSHDRRLNDHDKVIVEINKDIKHNVDIHNYQSQEIREIKKTTVEILQRISRIV